MEKLMREKEDQERVSSPSLSSSSKRLVQGEEPVVSFWERSSGKDTTVGCAVIR